MHSVYYHPELKFLSFDLLSSSVGLVGTFVWGLLFDDASKDKLIIDCTMSIATLVISSAANLSKFCWLEDVN